MCITSSSTLYFICDLFMFILVYHACLYIENEYVNVVSVHSRYGGHNIDIYCNIYCNIYCISPTLATIILVYKN